MQISASSGYTAKKPITYNPTPVKKAAPKPKTTTTYTAPKTTSVNSGSALPVSTPNYTSSATSDSSINDQINKMYDAQQKTQLDALKASQKKATDQLNTQKKSTTQDYYNQKNQADVVNQQNVQKLREVMAANGLNGSGENITANVGLANQRQQSLNGLNTKEQQAIDALNQKISDVNDPSQAQAIKNQIEQQRSGALANQYWNNYQFNNPSAAQVLSWQENQGNLDQQQASLMAQIAALQGFNGGGGGGGNYQSDLAKANQIVHMDPNQLGAFNWVIQHESSFNPSAQNPHSTAHGYGQFLNSTAAQYDKKMGLNYNASGANQLAETYQYMVDRYGGPTGAMKFWQTHGWY